MYDDLPTVRSGFWLCDGTLRLPIRIVQSPVRHGTGDHEDPPDISDDVEADCFYLVCTNARRN